MNEHAVWKGKLYKQGFKPLKCKKLAVVGYSHYTDEPDHVRLTIDTVESMLRGDFNPPFFTNIAKWFGFEDKSLFYDSVIFFNFLPRAVHGSDKYRLGTEEEVHDGQSRFLKIVRRYKPDYVVVFSKKGWDSFPESDGERNGGRAMWLGDELPKSFNRDEYTLEDGHTVHVTGLRHPLGAADADMYRAIKSVLNDEKIK